jgi:RNA polymerase sigma-70 factor (ECF subfamily)
LDTTRPSLLLRIRDPRDAKAWDLFDSIYRPLLRRYALGRGLEASDADDIAQQCIGEIHRRIGAFDYDPTKGRFKGWLKTMVANRVRNFLRDRHERQAATGDFHLGQEREPPPDENFDRLWMQEHLWHCLRELEEEVEQTTYDAFVGYVIEQRPIEQVCRETGLTANNIYTIKWRLTEKVADKMRQLLGDTE